jgi:hypothetical protein
LFGIAAGELATLPTIRPVGHEGPIPDAVQFRIQSRASINNWCGFGYGLLKSFDAAHIASFRLMDLS